MASISNQFISYADRWFFSKSFGKDDISRIDKTLLNTQESEQSKIDKILDSIENFTFYEYKGTSFDTRANYSLQSEGAVVDQMILFGDIVGRELSQNIEILEYRLSHQPIDYKTLPIPTESEFEDTKDRLLRQMKDILKETYLNKGGDSKEFLHLYNEANTVMNELEARKEARSELIKTLENAQNNPKYAKSQEFLDTLLYRFPFGVSHTYEELKERGKLWHQQASDGSFAMALRDFFTLANQYEAIPKYKQDSIERSLQVSEAYLYNQAVWDGQNKPYRIGNFVISSNYFSSEASITYLPNKLLTPLTSDFDSTQSFLELLDKREQLEKQNQDLKAKQALESYIAYNKDSTNSIIQTLLKDSKEAKDDKNIREIKQTIEIKNIKEARDTQEIKISKDNQAINKM
ncbi:MAG: hypothetical protein K2O80_03355 [Helicobacter apodemus]|nr:hypothetical protein [Helicobacter apodemus]